MITLKQLTNRAKKDNWTITNEEAIDIWLIIPERCERKTDTIMHNSFEKGYLITKYLLIKGLGEFKIE